MGLYERLIGTEDPKIPVHPFWGLMNDMHVARTHASVAWQASHAYELGDSVYDSPSGWYERVIVAGTSDATEPTWPGTGSGDTVDNTVTWREWDGSWITKEMIVDAFSLDAGEETELDDLIAALANQDRDYLNLHGILIAGEAQVAPYDSAQHVKDRLLGTG
jgi:hypothetical protein